MKIWIVNMGLGENCERSKAMRVFSTQEKAYAWVEKHFHDDIDSLTAYSDVPNGISIGNSFHIYPMEVDLEE